MTSIVRGQALARLGRRAEAVANLEEAVTGARALGEPPILLRALATLSSIEPTDERVSEARQTVQRVQAALLDGEARSRFASAPVVLEVLSR